MKMQVEQQIKEIWAILHAMAERENQMEIRFNKKLEAVERKREADQRAMNERMDRAEARMDKTDRQILATYKLVRQGMKMLVELGTAQKEMKAGGSRVGEGAEGSCGFDAPRKRERSPALVPLIGELRGIARVFAFRECSCSLTERMRATPARRCPWRPAIFLRSLNW